MLVRHAWLTQHRLFALPLHTQGSESHRDLIQRQEVRPDAVSIRLRHRFSHIETTSVRVTPTFTSLCAMPLHTKGVRGQGRGFEESNRPQDLDNRLFALPPKEVSQIETASVRQGVGADAVSI